ncbi:hypothetical protein [Altererythrobacter fulvus]|uniref:hypothetical protein n=1 Tax=Caenibius fulvus TaxID=2126012 RepID=UPI0030183D6E
MRRREHPTALPRCNGGREPATPGEEALADHCRMEAGQLPEKHPLNSLVGLSHGERGNLLRFAARAPVLAGMLFVTASSKSEIRENRSATFAAPAIGGRRSTHPLRSKEWK